MTKMIDILEDFMNKKKYVFFRLDGSCNIADRRDMVKKKLVLKQKNIKR
jgi:chromatin-remodeling ATPase INO80